MKSKPKRKNKPGAGRPRKRILTEQEKNTIMVLLGLGGTDLDCSRALGIPETTLKRNYGPILKHARTDFDAALRKRLGVLALKNGHPSVCIFLAKTRLGFKETINYEGHGTGFQFIEDKEKS